MSNNRLKCKLLESPYIFADAYQGLALYRRKP